MRRVAVFLTVEQCDRLQQIHDDTGVPVAELIRRYVDAGLENTGDSLKSVWLGLVATPAKKRTGRK